MTVPGANMIKTVRKTEYSGTVTAPPSKSDAHRALICAALCRGKSTIHGIGNSEDVRATLECLCALGAEIEENGDTVTVTGCDLPSRDKVTLPCRESGSTLRFLLPLCLLSDKEAVLTGSAGLMSRPIEIYEKICVGQGLEFILEDESVSVAGKLESGYFRVRGDVSSQFISGLMFALPLLDGFSVIEITPPIVSVPYIVMTAETLKKFGIMVEFTEDDKIIIQGGQKYVPCEYTVGGDWSGAAFFLAMSSLGHDVDVDGLDSGSLQGDAVIRKLLGKLRRGHPTVDISNCPDLAPILLAASAALCGVTLTGTERLKDKESDRGQAMAEELAKLGVHVTVSENTIELTAPRELKAPAVPIDSHNDHRIAMACAVLLTLVGGEILNAEAVNKSYPDFFSDLDALAETDH